MLNRRSLNAINSLNYVMGISYLLLNNSGCKILNSIIYLHINAQINF
ncbi:hypothetical protein SAMN06265367_108165 [Algoriphagus winogradskyi]|uniref:Uncharacterized protein n=1 Tax=Algoriphagus winogradskyi TaxID=237017 RepID=A0ABY1PFM0_9BACT|nr:hypothetical protein SAMN06265367_108165 [Algoriphagus winogradskyi]